MKRVLYCVGLSCIALIMVPFIVLWAMPGNLYREYRTAWEYCVDTY